jgi:hypothetical protein
MALAMLPGANDNATMQNEYGTQSRHAMLIPCLPTSSRPRVIRLQMPLSERDTIHKCHGQPNVPTCLSCIMTPAGIEGNAVATRSIVIGTRGSDCTKRCDAILPR